MSQISEAGGPEQSAPQGPLSGLVVADLSRVLAGPYCAMLLADMGATVIKVEGPGGDDTRQYIPPHRDGVSTYYMAVNRNKQTITLDFSRPEDLEVVYRIIDRADVLVENFKPGGLEKFGLDPESVAARWPDLIHATVTGFGTAGGAHMPGYDLIAQALSGFMDVTGTPDGEPQRAGVAIFDVITGLHTCIGVLAALQERGRSGAGQQVSTNLLSSALSGLVNQTNGYVAAGNIPKRQGNEHPSLFPYGPFRARDRDVIICIGNDSQFRRMCDRLGIPEVATDPRYATMLARNTNRDGLRALMVEALQAKDAQDWADEFMADKIPASPILTIGEGVDLAETLGLDPVRQVGSGESAVPTVANPIGFSRTPVRYDLAPPAMDADRAQVLQWIADTPARSTGA